MCVDNRIPIKIASGQYAHLARWQGQAGYVPVEQCGTFTPKGFVPDGERIERVLQKKNY